MGLELKPIDTLPVYNDGRIFNWEDNGYYLNLEDYTVMNRSGDYWEIFYKMTDLNKSQRVGYGSKDFCMRSVEHKIKQNELPK